MEEYQNQSESSSSTYIDQAELNEFRSRIQRLKSEMAKVIVGQQELVDLFIASMLVRGHLLIEGVPGIAKTLTAKMLSKTIDTGYSRIQFTPDLMPSDVLGTFVFNQKTSDFYFKKGPVFSNIVLIDEINRAPAKTQAALFEVMEENQVSMDGTTYKMEEPFIVIATQNPIEQEGTYKLPEAQLDRFIFKVNLKYPSLNEEREIIKRFAGDFQQKVKQEVKSIINADLMTKYQEMVQRVHIKNEILDYIAKLVYATRNNGDLFLGASPRASLAIMKTAKAVAMMRGRDFVTPDDIKHVAYPVLNHRVILSAEKELEGIDVKDVIHQLIKKIEIPR